MFRTPAASVAAPHERRLLASILAVHDLTDLEVRGLVGAWAAGRQCWETRIGFLRRAGWLLPARAGLVIAAYRGAVRHQSGYAPAHFAFAVQLDHLGRPDEAIAAYRQALRHRPAFPEAHCNLGGLYLAQGRYADAREHFRRGHELGLKARNWSHPSAVWLADAERVVALGPRVAAILAGTEAPADATDAAVTARVAQAQKRYLRSAELHRAALTADPSLARLGGSGVRFSAACAAARVGTGRGEGAARLDACGRAEWRRQALRWLRGELSDRRQEWTTATPEARRRIEDKLRNWQLDGDLAGVRDEAALATLPDAERADREGFWADVADVLVKARPAVPPHPRWRERSRPLTPASGFPASGRALTGPAGI